VDYPQILLEDPELLMDPTNNPHPLVVTGQLHLATIRRKEQAAEISGETSRLLTAGWSNGTNKAYKSVWSAGVQNNKLIPCSELPRVPDKLVQKRYAILVN